MPSMPSYISGRSMRWQEQPPDVEPAPVTELLRTVSALDAVMLIARMRDAPTVFLSAACREGILAHLRTQGTELGGLLIGRPYVAGPDLPDGWAPVIGIDGFLPSQT